jgi:hypothetical protein
MKSSINNLFILKNAQEGKPMEVTFPNGIKTGDTITVLGSDSEKFRAAMAVARREEIDAIGEFDSKTKPELLAEKQHEGKLKLVSSLVTGWTFEEDCTKENVITLFRNAPYILEQVDSFAANRRNFFVNPSTN